MIPRVFTLGIQPAEQAGSVGALSKPLSKTR